MFWCKYHSFSNKYNEDLKDVLKDDKKDEIMKWWNDEGIKKIKISTYQDIWKDLTKWNEDNKMKMRVKRGLHDVIKMNWRWNENEMSMKCQWNDDMMKWS